MPKLSLIIPCYNEEKTLKPCVDRVLEIASESLELEIIIVDDCSTDNTKDLLKRSSVRSILLEKSVGSAKARNIGIKEAKNDIIALTDSDCFVSRNWLKDLVPYLKTYDVVGGKVIFKDEIEKKLNPSITTETIISEDSPVNFLNTSNMLFKKDIFKQTRGFLSYRLEDVEFSWRLLKRDFRLYYASKGLVYHQGTRTPIQNIRKLLDL